MRHISHQMTFSLYLDLNKIDSNNRKYIEINLYNKTDKKISYNINCSQANAFLIENPTSKMKISNLKNLNFYFADLIQIIKKIKWLKKISFI